jgi:hypothetical protein
MDSPFRRYGPIADPKDASRRMIALYQGLTAASFFLTVDVLKLAPDAFLARDR